MIINSPITLGADPEIGYMKNNEQVIASKLVSNNSFGVGLDGHSDISEVRLKTPLKTPKEMVAEIAGYFKELNKKIPKDVIVIAGGMVGDDPMGGHLHWGKTKYTKINDMKNYGGVLDLYLALPTLMLEDPADAQRRRNSSYGRLFIDRSGAIETKNYGGFEYRTLASYLVSPTITDSIISLGHTIVHEIDYGSAKLKNLKSFKKSEEINKAFNCADKKFLYKYVPKIFKDIQKCMLFRGNYEKEIAGLFGLIKAFSNNNKTWMANKDILVRWGIRKPEAAKEAKEQEITTTPAEDTRSFPLAYGGGDYNLGDIIPRLSNNRYIIPIYVYGIRDDHGVSIAWYITDAGRVAIGNLSLNIPNIGDPVNEILTSLNAAVCYIGITKSLRRNPSTCTTMLESILAPLRVQVR